MPEATMIDMQRITMMGGLGNHAVRSILARFISELPQYLERLNEHESLGDRASLLATLHRMKGASRTCGFVAVAEAAGAWHEAPEHEAPALRQGLLHSIDRTIEEWNAVASSFKETP